MNIIKKVKEVFVKKKETKPEESNPRLEALMKEKEEATRKGEPWVAVLDTQRLTKTTSETDSLNWIGTMNL
jgi:hypothetical protein